MDNDLISRNSLKEKIENIMTWHDEYEESEWLSCAKEILNLLTNAPTVELDGYVLYGTGLELVSTDWLEEQLGKDRQRGKWIIDGHHIRCNRCNEYICNTDREGNKIPDNFCPNCGADMR